MLSLIVYMIIGAVLMYIVVDGKKLEDSLPEWYADYKADMKDKPYGFFERSTFDKTVKRMIAAWFLFAWPSALFLLASKLVKGKK